MSNSFIFVINSLFPEPQASLLSGILFGTKESMPKYFYNALIDTGTLHMIALSGMNISILINLAGKATLFMGKKISIIITIFLITIFTLFVGASPSIVRAAIMGSFSLVAVYFGRLDWSLLSLFLAGGLMLLFRPFLVYDLSFQLSFLATLGITLFSINTKKVASRLLYRLLFPVLENLRMTLAAQIFTLPIILYKFHRISLVSPLANLLLEWVIQPVMVLGFITVILGKIWLPLGIIPSWFAWLLLSYMIFIIEILAKIPGASIKF